jgi:hypothetical protein
VRSDERAVDHETDQPTGVDTDENSTESHAAAIAALRQANPTNSQTRNRLCPATIYFRHARCGTWDSLWER